MPPGLCWPREGERGLRGRPGLGSRRRDQRRGQRSQAGPGQGAGGVRGPCAGAARCPFSAGLPALSPPGGSRIAAPLLLKLSRLLSPLLPKASPPPSAFVPFARARSLLSLSLLSPGRVPATFRRPLPVTPEPPGPCGLPSDSPHLYSCIC